MQKEIFLSDYRAPAWRISTIDLVLDIHDGYTEVESTLQVIRCDPTVNLLVLQGESLELLWLERDGQRLSASEYVVLPDGLALPFTADQGVVRSVVRIDPAHNTTLEGFYASGPILCTQCEPEGFRHITWFIDRPDQLARFTTTLKADQQRYPVLLANGNRIAAGTLDGGRHFATFSDPTLKPSYLFAAVAADLKVRRDEFVTQSGRRVQLEIYAESRDIGQCAFALNSLKTAMRWDEVRYGREYDLDVYVIVAVSYFNMGAMENKGLNIFNTACVLADPQLTTDAGFYRVESVIAHEYLHNWTGNRVTCRDWFQLCLKEGLTVFRDQQFSAEQHSQAVQRIDQLSMLKTVQFAEDAGPRSHPVRPSSYKEINNFYTATVYEKGAEIVRMLHWRLGSEAFRQGMDCYFSRHDGQAVTVEDFMQALSDGSGIDIKEFMPWYEIAGTPVIQVEERWHAQTSSFVLRLTQSQATLLPVPFRLGFLDQSGQPLAWHSSAFCRDDAVLLRERVTEISVEAVKAAPVPVLLKGFSAPVRLERVWKEAELRTVIMYETDPVSRWLAIQDWWVLLLHQQLQARESSFGVSVVQVAHAVLQQAEHDPAWVSRMFQLPAFAVVALGRSPVDPLDFYAVRRKLLQHLGRALNWSPWLAELQSEQACRRALAEVAWTFYAAASGMSFSAELVKAYAQAPTMTARQACIAPLYHLQGVAASWVRQDWSERYAAHPLVMDRWFSMQAGHAETTLEQVKALLDHPQFDWNNPNRVRSVLVSLAQSNPQFHRKDAAGYQLLAAAVVRLDRSNPQLAARLLSMWDTVMLMPVDYQERVRRTARECLGQCRSADVMEMRDKWLS